MSGTEIIRCNCKHAYQDKIHGIGKRVGNVMRTGQIRCTVCCTIAGTKETVSKSVTPKAEPIPAKPAESAAAKTDKKGGKDNKGKEKEKKSSRDKTPKPKIDRSRKMGKK